MKKIRNILLSIMTAAGFVALPLVPVAVSADNPADSIQQGVQQVGGDKQGSEDLTNGIKTIVNVLLFILGAIAVIMIIIGGIRYTTSNGESAQIQSAKNTILYAVVGLVVAILAYAIVNFVIGAFKGNS